VGGQIHEDLMDRIWDISPEDLPFTDMCEKGSSSNHYKEFVEEQLEASNALNMQVDGAEMITENDTVTGKRKGAYHQISTKTIQVSDRARNVNTVGTSDELVKQVTKRQRALRRDVEARLSSNYSSAPGDALTVPSQAPGIGAWVGTSEVAGVTVGNQDRGAATGAAPELSDNVDAAGYPTVGPVAGTARPLTETTLKTMIQAAYKNGGNLRYAMGTPEVIEILSDYMFTSSARVATIQTNAPQGNRQGVDGGNGTAGGGVAAQGAVNMYVSNYGTVIFVPNRFQPQSLSGVPAEVDGQSDLFLIDPDLWECSYLQGYRTKTLGDTGLSAKRLISVDYTLCAKAEYGNAVIADISHADDMVA
jgi:hypothetical protein